MNITTVVGMIGDDNPANVMYVGVITRRSAVG